LGIAAVQRIAPCDIDLYAQLRRYSRNGATDPDFRGITVGVAASAGINKVEASLHQLGVQALAVGVVALYAMIVTWKLDRRTQQ
jgi:hypothetical protein